MERVNSDDRAQFDEELNAHIPGTERVITPDTPVDELAAFSALTMQVGGL